MSEVALGSCTSCYHYRCFEALPNAFPNLKMALRCPCLEEQVHPGRVFRSTSPFRAPTSSRLIGGPAKAISSRAPQARGCQSMSPQSGGNYEPRGQTAMPPGRAGASCSVDGNNTPPPPARPLEPSAWDVRVPAIFSSPLGGVDARHSSILQHRTPTIRTPLTCLCCY